MISATDITNKRESVFTYHEDGVTRCWAVGRLLRDLRCGKLEGEMMVAPLMEATANSFYTRGGLGDQRIRDIAGDVQRLFRPGVITTLEGLNDGRHIIVDGRHRYVALTMMYGHLPETSMQFTYLTESQMARYEIAVAGEFTESQMEKFVAHVSEHVE